MRAYQTAISPTSGASSSMSRGILRWGTLGQHRGLSGQGSHYEHGPWSLTACLVDTHKHCARHQIVVGIGEEGRAAKGARPLGRRIGWCDELRSHVTANVTQIQEAVDATQQMIVRNVILQAEVVKQTLRCRVTPSTLSNR